ncbi:trigger factor [Pseudanabaena sp. FACHB-2040]|uniref:trigger factor n=1 Tax=Pseudanabaena sp. FACHB-2040 TaxID=2692859 RepID=UPI001685E6D7|nr:trigger factor [Pseudanabaena sp. FACHB-2040]MBD2260292.1 trigger factor [Pseudanabaena sp. FACHB-2040]
MKVTQEKLPDSQVGLEIEIPADMSRQTYEQVLRKYMNSMNIPGFRKGKVPRQVFLQRVGVTQFKAAVLEELVQNAVDKAIKQEEIEAIGNYQLKSSIDDLIAQYEPGQDLTISAAVDVPPRVTLKQYSGFTAQAEEVKPKLEQVDETLEQYRTNLATLVPVEDRPAQIGDIAVVDFVGKVKREGEEPEEFSGGSAQDFQVELQDGRFIEGFVQGIVGMTLDETKEIEVTFPEGYPQEDLAGQEAVFTITVKEIKEKELPELDDDFAQEVSEFETLAELRQSLEERYRNEAEQQTKTNREQALLAELVKQLDVEIPSTLIQREVDFLLTQTVMQLSNQGLDVNKLLTPELIAGMRERTRPEAIERLQRTLALGEVAKHASITVEEAEIEAKADEMMAEISDPTKVDPQRLREVVQEDLLQDKILAWLEENSTLELVPEGTLTPAEEEEASPDPAVASIDVEAEVVEAAAEDSEE